MFPISSLSFFFSPCFLIFAFNFVSVSFNFLKPNCFEFQFLFSKISKIWKYLDPPLNTVFKSYFQHEYCVAVPHTSAMQKRATYTVGITFAVRDEHKLILEIVVQIAKKFDILKYTVRYAQRFITRFFINCSEHVSIEYTIKLPYIHLIILLIVLVKSFVGSI